MSEPEGRYLSNSIKKRDFLLQLRHRLEFGDENFRISLWGMMIIENIKSFWDFLFFLDFFEVTKKSQVFLWFSSMKNHGKTQGNYWRTLGKLDNFFWWPRKKTRKNRKLKNFLYFQLSSYLIKRSCNFHRQTPNGDEAVIKNPSFLYYLPDIDLHRSEVQISFGY